MNSLRDFVVLTAIVFIGFRTIPHVLAQQVDVQYLNPKFGTSSEYKFARFGNSSSYYAGFMNNISNASFGEGNNFAIFTYDNRDLVLRSGAGNTILNHSGSGNIGIGLVNPDERLHVSGAVKFQRASGGSNYLKIHSSSHATFLTTDDPGTNQKHMVLQVSPTSNDAEDRHLIFQTGKKEGAYQTRLRILGNGKVGIGNHTPNAKLDVKGHANDYSNYNFIVRDRFNNADFKIRGTGQVEIGYQTTIHNSSHYLLAVGGGAYFEEVKVQLKEDWPDYVFEDDFKLQDLSELETYIKNNKHLPGIPTAQEVKDNDGIELGEMNRLLLGKIEELTLYMIDQKRANDLQSEEIEALKAQNKLLKEQNEYILSKIED